MIRRLLFGVLFIPLLMGSFAFFFLDWVVRGASARDWPTEFLDWISDL